MAWNNNCQQYKNDLVQTNAQLLALSPEHKINISGNRVANCWQQIQLMMNNQLHQQRLQLTNQVSTLNALSPLQTMSRGYSITYDSNGKALKNASSLKRGDTLKTRLHENEVLSVIKDISE